MNLWFHRFSSSRPSCKLLRMKLVCDKMDICIRALIDTETKRSYTKKELATQLGLKPKHMENLTHSLLGGIETRTKKHPIYDVNLKT